MKRKSFNQSKTSVLALVTGALLMSPPLFADSTDSDLDTMLHNASTELKVKTALLEHIGWDMLTVDVEAAGSEVTLTGLADNRANQEMAKEVARSVDGVEKVNNHLKIEREPTEAPVGKAVADAELELKDAVLESRVKTELIAELGMAAFDIEVEATDGTVSLRGHLEDERHRALAVDTVESCKGVDKVISLLQITQS